jgi:hypothetical protein
MAIGYYGFPIELLHGRKKAGKQHYRKLYVTKSDFPIDVDKLC